MKNVVLNTAEKISSKKRKLDCIQILRAIAVILIVFFHISHFKTFNLKISSGYQIGVDLFFVISGFIIYYVTLEIPSSFKSAATFLAKRAIRIIPTYWFYMLLLLIINHVYLNHYHFDFFKIVGSIFFIPVNRVMFHTSMFRPYLLSGWTLFYEIYFYFFVAIILLFCARKHRLIVATIYVFTAIYLPRILAIHFSNISLFGIYFNYSFAIDGILIEFIFGMLIAWIYFTKFKIGKIASVFLFAISLIIFLAAAKENLPYLSYISVKVFGRISIHYTRFLKYGIPAAIFLFSFLYLDKAFSIKYSKLFLLIGDASYSIYLSHEMFGYLFQFYYGKFVSLTSYTLLDPIPFFTTILFSIALGIVCYCIIEKPIITFLKTRLLAEKPKNV